MIKSIKVLVGGKEVEMTIDEARQLYGELREILGVKEHVPYLCPAPSPWTPPEWPEVTYTDNTDNKIIWYKNNQ